MGSGSTASLGQARARRSRLRVLDAALASFAEAGFAATTFAGIAARAGVSAALACRYFPTKEHLILAAYDALATELSARAAELPRAPVAERFRALCACKLAALERQRDAYSALAASALDRSTRAAVLGPAAEGIRARVAALFEVIVAGASDAPADPDARARLARALYVAHLLLVLVWTQDASRGQKGTRALLDFAARSLTSLGPMLPFALAGPTAIEVDALVAALVALPRRERDDERARAILDRLLRDRRVLPGVPPEPSDAARALHLPLVLAAIRERRPIELVLPAFPAKSPNPKKVLGVRPDAAEEIALGTLADLVRDISALHPPGAHLVICSDGHVFADAVGVRDADIDRYRSDIESMIRAIGGGALRFFGLEDVVPGAAPDAARAWLFDRFAEDVASLRARARAAALGAGRDSAFAGPSIVQTQIDGIHRFLTEDLAGCTPGLSRSQARKQTRDRAYEVVRRSEAWGRLVAHAFPGALRLSIHPQPDISEKIGIHLMPTDDAWLTPWHGVAVFDGERHRLAHRADAEAAGATIVEEDGRPYALRLDRAARPAEGAA